MLLFRLALIISVLRIYVIKLCYISLRVAAALRMVGYRCTFSQHEGICVSLGRVLIQLRSLPTAALGGREWSSRRHGRFTLGEGVPGAHWTGGNVGPTAGLNA